MFFDTIVGALPMTQQAICTCGCSGSFALQQRNTQKFALSLLRKLRQVDILPYQTDIWPLERI